ncbi:reverse transcriptase domain-containing protein [Tanacetum coccineum]
MPSHIKTYDGSEDPEDHLKIFQTAAKTERRVMPTWCHMFNSTLTGNARVWFDDLLPESINSYDDLKKAFLENYLQQKKCIKDPIEIHNIKQREGESTEDFVKRYKLESRDVNGAPECMRISGFVHGITNPELIKRLHDKIPKTVNEMMRIEEMLKEGKLAHLIKELKQNNGKEQPKVTKKGETSGKDKARLRPEIRKQLIPATTLLIGFSGEIIWPIGQIQLLVKIGDEEYSASAWMNFMVVRSSSPYNGFIGIPGVRKLQAVPSTAHGMLKILVERGVITLKSSKLVPLECAVGVCTVRFGSVFG